MNRIGHGLAIAALLGLAACGQGKMPWAKGDDAAVPPGQTGRPGANAWPGATPGQQPGFGPMAQNPMAPNPNGPQPSFPQQPGQPGAPGAPGQPAPYGPTAQYPQQPGYPPANPGYPNGPTGPGTMPPGGGQLQVSRPPNGMRAVPSQGGYVFVANIGAAQASSVVQQMVAGTATYFDGPPRVIGNQTDPTDRMSQVAFNATMRGAQVAGIMAVMTDGRSQGMAYLLFDEAGKVQQTMPAMMAAAQNGGGGNPQANMRGGGAGQYPSGQ